MCQRQTIYKKNLKYVSNRFDFKGNYCKIIIYLWYGMCYPYHWEELNIVGKPYKRNPVAQ